MVLVMESKLVVVDFADLNPCYSSINTFKKGMIISVIMDSKNSGKSDKIDMGL